MLNQLSMAKETASNKHQAHVRQDACIQADAWLAFWKAEETHCLDTSGLEVKVRGCKLWLHGYLPDGDQCKLAQQLAQAISGVKAVINQMVIDEKKG